MKKIAVFLFVLFGLVAIYLIVLLNGLLVNISQELSAPDTDKEKGLRIAFIYQNDNEQFWSRVKKGAVKAAAGSGVYLNFCEALHGKDLQLYDYLRLAIDARYNGIIIHAEDETVIPLIKEAEGNGIPVILIASDLPESGRISYIGTNNYLTGYVAGKTLLKTVGKSGKKNFAVITALTEDNLETPTAEALKVFGFREAISIAQPVIPVWVKCKSSLFDSIQVMQSVLKEHPNLDAVYVTHSAGTLAAAKVLSERSSGRKITLVGYGDSYEVQDYIKQGIISASIVDHPYQMGFTALNQMLLCLHGNGIYTTNNIDVLIANRENLLELKKRGALP